MMNHEYFAGTWTLFKLMLKRDRILVLVWIFIPFLLALATAGSFGAMDLNTAMKDFTSDPVISAIQGPVLSEGLDGVVIWRMMGLNVILLGIAGVLTVVRHTRLEEETGRSELIRSYATGRHANLTAALVLSLMIDVLAGLTQAVLLAAIGGSLSGALTFGGTIAFAGFVYACLAAIAVQLRESTGTARGIGLMTVGIGFLMMVVNNGSGGYTALKWVTPMAWHRLTQPMNGNYGAYYIYFILVIGVIAFIAYKLSTHRDLGAGILPSRPGRAEAPPSLKSPLALAWRLHKGAFRGWLVGISVFGAGIGMIAQNISHNAEMGSILGNLGGTNWVEAVGNQDAFIAIIVYIISLAVALYAIMAVLKPHHEEAESRAELILSRSVERNKWYAGHISIAFVTSAVLLFAMGLGSGLVYGISSDNVAEVLPRMMIMCLSKIPAVWMMAGIASFVNGLLPKASTACSFSIWGLFAALELLWEASIVSWSAMSFSPFSTAHYTIPVEELTIPVLYLLMICSVLLAGGGVITFRRRDILTKV